jgi:hypothetical protein
VGGDGTSGSGEDVEKGCRRVNIVQILCTHARKWKMIPVGTIPGMGIGKNKREWRGRIQL